MILSVKFQIPAIGKWYLVMVKCKEYRHVLVVRVLMGRKLILRRMDLIVIVKHSIQKMVAGFIGFLQQLRKSVLDFAQVHVHTIL